MSSTFRNDKDARRLSAIAVVACSYGDDMPESLCNELLNDIDFYYNKVKCCKIERMLSVLSKMVIEEQKVLKAIIPAYCKNIQHCAYCSLNWTTLPEPKVYHLG